MSERGPIRLFRVFAWTGYSAGQDKARCASGRLRLDGRAHWGPGFSRKSAKTLWYTNRAKPGSRVGSGIAWWFDDIHRARCLSYLKVTGPRLYLALDFGRLRLEVKRMVRNF